MSEDIHKWTRGRYVLMFDEHTFFVWDNENDERMTALNVTKKLNEQQSTITGLEQEIELISNTKLFSRRELERKVDEQQDKITELEKNFDDIVKWASEIAKRNVILDEKIGRLQQEEKLYAQEILRLNELLKQYQANQDLGGGY